MQASDKARMDSNMSHVVVPFAVCMGLLVRMLEWSPKMSGHARSSQRPDGSFKLR